MISRIRFTRYRQFYLLASLLLGMVVRPFVADRLLGIALIDVFLFVTLVTGALATAGSRGHLIVIGCLALISTVTKLLWDPGDPTVYLQLYYVSTLAYLAGVIVALAQPLYRPLERVTADTLYGALSLYLLVGLLFAVLFAGLEYAAPGSFTFPPSDAPLFGADGTDFDRFLGFSFTTLTTLGYGNIAPTTPRAEALTSLEAIVGQIYLAVIVARLVALQTTQGSPGSGQLAQAPRALPDSSSSLSD